MGIVGNVELVFNGQAELGEGPAWYDGALWWVNITKGELHRWDSKTGRDSIVFAGAPMLGAAVPCRDGRWLLARQDGFHYLDLEQGGIKAIVDPEADRPENRFNDGKCDPAGRFWAGSLNLAGASKQAALYCLEQNGSCRCELAQVSLANGLGWSGDGKRFFFIDTLTYTVKVFDYDLKAGTLHDGRILVRFSSPWGTRMGWRWIHRTIYGSLFGGGRPWSVSKAVVGRS